MVSNLIFSKISLTNTITIIIKRYLKIKTKYFIVLKKIEKSSFKEVMSTKFIPKTQLPKKLNLKIYGIFLNKVPTKFQKEQANRNHKITFLMILL